MKIFGNKKGSGTILILALLLLAIFTIAANYVAVSNVSAATQPSLGRASTFAVLAQTGAVTLDDDNVNLTCALVSPITTTIVTTINGVATTIVTTSFSITTFPTGTIIPEYPWGVLLLLILMLPAYMLLKRRTRRH